MTGTARLSLAGLVCVFASGCITASTVIHVKPDGSGTIEQAVAMKAEAAEQLAAMASGFGGDSPKPEAGKGAVPELFNEKEMRDAATKYGEGVAFVSSKPIKTKELVGRSAIYSFTDITKVHINQKPPAPKDGMTYEQASARGLAYKREDGTVLTYRDGILHHFTSAITTCYTAATNREQILRDFLEYRRTAISDGEKSSTREYVLTPGSDTTLADRLAESLASQGIDVRRAEEAFTIGTRKIAAGAYLVSNAQPSGRLLRNLLEPDVHQPEAFVKEQDRRRKKRMGDQIYDVTACPSPRPA